MEPHSTTYNMITEQNVIDYSAEILMFTENFMYENAYSRFENCFLKISNNRFSFKILYCRVFTESSPHDITFSKG